jgi:hypothetical protein
VEVVKDASQLGVVTEVGQRRVPARDEHARIRAELFVRDRREWPGREQVVLHLLLLDELGLLRCTLVSTKRSEGELARRTLSFSQKLPMNANGVDLESGSMFGCFPFGEAN